KGEIYVTAGGASKVTRFRHYPWRDQKGVLKWLMRFYKSKSSVAKKTMEKHGQQLHVQHTVQGSD
ncbi:hypothetical protein, partial [Ligilactobacillus ruminis]|uniref:hypothetical protein n=1 Tax=Ligilactobacillus ruminis TaxID=1623 RepID=UPI001F4E6062